MHEDNFIVNFDKKELYAVDLDSSKISNNRSFPSRYMTPFSLLNNNTSGKYKLNTDKNNPSHIVANENSDLYCYSIVILNYLYGDSVNNFDIIEFYNYLNYLDKLKIDLNLLGCFNKLLSNENNENPVNYIDSLSSEQIHRARKIVYKCQRR